MKVLLSVLTFSFVFSMGFAAQEGPKKEETKIDTKKVDTPSTTTAHNFEDLLVQGKYHFSDEAVTTVEEDKVLDNLIGVRADFKDRLKSSTGSY